MVMSGRKKKKKKKKKKKSRCLEVTALRVTGKKMQFLSMWRGKKMCKFIIHTAFLLCRTLYIYHINKIFEDCFGNCSFITTSKSSFHSFQGSGLTLRSSFGVSYNDLDLL